MTSKKNTITEDEERKLKAQRLSRQIGKSDECHGVCVLTGFMQAYKTAKNTSEALKCLRVWAAK